MNLTELSQQIYKSAKAKGYYRETSEKGTGLMLIVAEVAEALEADRRANYADEKAYSEELQKEVEEEQVEAHKEDAYFKYIAGTFEEELADVLLQLLSFTGSLHIDIEKFVKLKMQYNEKRPRLHNKVY